jgi:hypothetical protein
MAMRRSSFRWFVPGKARFVIAALIGLGLTAAAVGAANDKTASLQGTVQSADTGLAGYKVSLYASFVDRRPSWKLLGSDASNGAGNFRINYSLPHGPADEPPILFVQAERGPIDTKKCPAGMRVGDPISPDTGYTSDSLQRITGGQIDPSGNVWLTNNWKIDSDGFVNPGGNAVVIAIGAGAPVKTPLIGPPVPFK